MEQFKDIDPDRIGAIYNHGISEGLKHVSPSQETLTRLKALEESHTSFDNFRIGMERSFGKMEGKIDGLTTHVTDLKGSIMSLQQDFQTMEKGRLTQLEVKFATLSTEVAYSAKNISFYTAIAASVASSVVAGVILYFLVQ